MWNAGCSCLPPGFLLVKAAVVAVDVLDNGGGCGECLRISPVIDV